MKRKTKKTIALLLTLLVTLSLTTTPLAADTSITFLGIDEGFVTQTGEAVSDVDGNKMEYTKTDLFDNFKDVMPGDELSQYITIKNDSDDFDYIKLYMKADVHDEENNPLTYEEPLENIDGKDQTDIAGQRDETVASMQEFLAQLEMRLYNGEELIYNASPDEEGALLNNVLLGALSKGESLNLKAELDVPKELGNEYANRVGEVDWVFLAEGFNEEKLTVHKVWFDCCNIHSEHPESVTVQLLRDGKLYDEVELSWKNYWTHTWDDLEEGHGWTVVEKDVPDEYRVFYEKTDNIYWIMNYKKCPIPDCPDEPTTEEPVDLTVKKEWDGDEKKIDKRPTSVSVTLFDGTTPVDKVILNAENNWTYIWEDLDADGNWGVLETGVPKGYVPSYSAEGNVVTITNTASLIQTGQMNWPVLLLGGLGGCMLLYGAYVLMKKRKDKYV